MKSLNDWREEQINEEMAPEQAPMQIVQTVMSQIAPLVQNAHQQIENWPEEREKNAARRTLDSLLLKASRDQWMGRSRMAVNQMNRGLDPTKAMKRFGNVNTTAANQLVGQ